MIKYPRVIIKLDCLHDGPVRIVQRTEGVPSMDVEIMTKDSMGMLRWVDVDMDSPLRSQAFRLALMQLADSLHTARGGEL